MTASKPPFHQEKALGEEGTHVRSAVTSPHARREPKLLSFHVSWLITISFLEFSEDVNNFFPYLTYNWK